MKNKDEYVKGKYLKRIKRRNTIKIIVILCVFLLAVTVMIVTKEKTMILEPETFVVQKEVPALFMREEAVMYFGHDIIGVEAEGAKVAKDTVLAKQLDILKYVEREKMIIDAKLTHYMYEDRSAFLADMKKVYSDSTNLKSADEEAVNKRNIMFATVKYLFYSEEELKRLKERFDGVEASSEVTLRKVPIDFTGQLFYSSDGFEEIASPALLSVASPEYLDFIMKLNAEKLDKHTTMTLKIADNSCVYVAFVLPLETKVDYEATVMDYKNNVLTKQNVANSDYYKFLENRMDILTQYPQMRFWVGQDSYLSRLVDVKEYQEKKVIVLMVTHDVEKLMTIRRATVKAEVEQYKNVFVVPKASVYKNAEGRDCIDIIDKNKTRKSYGVHVRGYDEESGSALIDTKGVLLPVEPGQEEPKSVELKDSAIVIR